MVMNSIRQEEREAAKTRHPSSKPRTQSQSQSQPLVPASARPFALHEHHVEGIIHDTDLCGICEVRTIIREGITALIKEAYGEQHND